jgi:hypothetical protein
MSKTDFFYRSLRPVIRSLSNDCAVLALDLKPNSFTFTTIHTPATENHAVSGHRQFGSKIMEMGVLGAYWC